MPSMNYCYHNRWVSQPGRLLKLTKVQQKPSPTKDNSSTGARENQIRRRVFRMNSVNSQSYLKNQKDQIEGMGPFFGESKFGAHKHCKNNMKKMIIYRSNGGSGSNVVYFKRVAVGSLSAPIHPCKANNCNIHEIKKACSKINGGNCRVNGKAWQMIRSGL
jgi:hypothetical protein